MLKIHKLILFVSGLLFVGQCLAFSQPHYIYFHITNESNLSNSVFGSNAMSASGDFSSFAAFKHSFDGAYMNILLGPDSTYQFPSNIHNVANGSVGVSVDVSGHAICLIRVLALENLDSERHPYYLFAPQAPMFSGAAVVSESNTYACWAQRRDDNHVDITVMNLPK